MSSSSTPEKPVPGDDREELREKADERLAGLPAETALGHADPAAGVDVDPETYQGDHNS